MIFFSFFEREDFLIYNNIYGVCTIFFVCRRILGKVWQMTNVLVLRSGIVYSTCSFPDKPTDIHSTFHLLSPVASTPQRREPESQRVPGVKGAAPSPCLESLSTLVDPTACLIIRPLTFPRRGRERARRHAATQFSRRISRVKSPFSFAYGASLPAPRCMTNIKGRVARALG